MTIHPEFITEFQETALEFIISEELEAVTLRNKNGRNRILRIGWDYLNTKKWIGEVPGSVPSWIPSIGGGEDSITINEYISGHSIAPHIDSPKFGDVAILSLLADATMRFTSPAGEIKDLLLPRRSLAIMSGELRTKWEHSTLPLAAARRISVVYRKRL